jgi:hypothetical protein
MSAEAQLPEAGVVQQALRATTEKLALELAHPGDTTPDWTEFEWRAARAASAIHGVSPLLAAKLRWRGPPGWDAFLVEQRGHTEIRHQRIEALAKLVDERARRIGLPIVALKGAALHAMGVYLRGERPMADLDFLVREADMPAALRLLEEQDFREELAFWKNRVFTPNNTSIAPRTAGHLGEHRDNPIKIELHWRIREKLPFELTDITEVSFPTTPHPGLNAYPSLAALLMHLVFHAAGSMASRDLRLLHLHDLSLICARMQPEDWQTILKYSPDGNGPWWFLPPLRLASRYYPNNLVPEAVLTRLEQGCPPWLNRLTARQTLTDVSLSSVWIRAFPGIEWSQSLLATFKYLAGRVRPDAEARTVRKSDAATASWAADARWQNLPQRSRILRWMTSRPTRTATMYVIQNALAQPEMGQPN